MTISLRTFLDTQMAARPMEVKALKKLYRAIKPVEMYDGEEETKFSTQAEFLDLAFNLDEFRVYTADDSWVFVTMGEGCDMICDYTTDLEDALKPLNDWLEKNEDKF